MNGGSKTETVDVSIEKVKDLRLVVLDGDNNIFCDHADWADARLVSSDSVSATGWCSQPDDSRRRAGNADGGAGRGARLVEARAEACPD